MEKLLEKLNTLPREIIWNDVHYSLFIYKDNL